MTMKAYRYTSFADFKDRGLFNLVSAVKETDLDENKQTNKDQENSAFPCLKSLKTLSVLWVLVAVGTTFFFKCAMYFGE